MSQMALVVKNPPASAGDKKRHGFDPWVQKIPLNNPLQYPCLENPMNRGACGLQSIGSQRVRHD